MKVKKDYYMGIEEDLSVGTLISFFLVVISVITVATIVLFNI